MPDVLVIHLKLIAVHTVRHPEEDLEMRSFRARSDAIVVCDDAQVECRENRRIHWPNRQ